MPFSFDHAFSNCGNFLRQKFGDASIVAAQTVNTCQIGSVLISLAAILITGSAIPVLAQTVNSQLGLLRGSSDGAQLEEQVEVPVFNDSEPVVILPDEEITPQIVELPEEDQTQGRARRSEPQTPLLDDINTGTPSPRANVRAGQVEEGTPRAQLVDPFVAQGFRMGTWQAYASVEQNVAFSTNVSKSAFSGEGVYSLTDLNLSAQSDWSRHQARINASATLQRIFGAEEAFVPSGNVDGSLRLDLRDGVSTTLSAGYDYTTESVTSTVIGADVNERPGVHTINGAVGIERSGNRLDFSLRGSLARSTHEDASLSIGGVLTQKDRDNTLYLLTGRLGYETSQAVKPFVEGEIGTRVFDSEIDRNGQRRGSRIYVLRSGVEIDLGEKLLGEVSVGYRIEDFEDAALDNLEGFSVDGSVEWSPWRETMVRLTAETAFTGSTSAGQNGSITNAIGFTVNRQVNDRLMLEAIAGIDVERMGGDAVDSIGWNVGTGFEYSVSRFLALTGSVEFEHVNSDNAAQSYEATMARVGVKMQR